MKRAQVTAIPSDHLSMRTPVAPATTRPVANESSMALKVSGWTSESASTKQRISPPAAAAPPLRTEAMRRSSTRTTRQPRSRAMAAVRSVETLSATITSIAPGPRRHCSRAVSSESSNRGRNRSSLCAGITNEIRIWSVGAQESSSIHPIRSRHRGVCEMMPGTLMGSSNTSVLSAARRNESSIDHWWGTHDEG